MGGQRGKGRWGGSLERSARIGRLHSLHARRAPEARAHTRAHTGHHHRHHRGADRRQGAGRARHYGCCDPAARCNSPRRWGRRGWGGVGGGLGFSVRIMLFPSRLRLCPLPARAHAIAPLLWPRAKFIFLRLCFLLPPCLPPRPHLLPWPCICESAAPSFRLEVLLSLCCSVQNLQNPSQAS